MKISFILLAHEPADQLKALIISLLSAGSDVYVHHDLNSADDLEQIALAWDLTQYSGKLYHAERVRVGWGEWSIVQATLNCLRLARAQGYQTDYMMLLSGSCMPIKPIAQLETFLFEHPNKDFIEAVDAVTNRWVTGGIQQERWERFFPYNFRTQRKRFEWLNQLQRKLKIKRSLPLQHTPHMGSQWWCLRTTTLDQVLTLLDQHPDIEAFYRYTWIPDELFFQTLVANLVATEQLQHEILTRYTFNSHGIPRVYYDDDLAELMCETTFFARKISHRAQTLRAQLCQVATQDMDDFADYIAGFRTPFLESLRFKLNYDQNWWHHLILKKINKYDYVKSIPNKIIALSYSSLSLGYRAVVELSQGIPNLHLIGNITNQPMWHERIGEIAWQHPNKTLLIDLGTSGKAYIDVLRWAPNVTLLYIQQDVTDYFANKQLSASEIQTLVRRETEMQEYMNNLQKPIEHHCTLYQFSIDELAEVSARLSATSTSLLPVNHS